MIYLATICAIELKRWICYGNFSINDILYVAYQTSRYKLKCNRSSKSERNANWVIEKTLRSQLLCSISMLVNLAVNVEIYMEDFPAAALVLAAWNT